VSKCEVKERFRGDCCCEHCNTWTQMCPECCKCVPRRLCVVFTPDGFTGTGGTNCRRCSLRLHWQTGNVYTGTLTCNGASVTVTISLIGSTTGTGTVSGCRWRVEIPELDIDQHFTVRAETGTGGVGCSSPEFEFAVTLAAGTGTGTGGTTCTGTLTISRDDNWVMPLRRVPTTGTGTGSKGCWEDFCGNGNCLCLNRKLCPTLTTEDCTYVSEDPLEFDDDSMCWSGTLTCAADDSTRSISVCLHRGDNGECLLVPTIGNATGTGATEYDPHEITSDCDSLNETINLGGTGTGTPGDTLTLTDAECGPCFQRAFCPSCNRYISRSLTATVTDYAEEEGCGFEEQIQDAEVPLEFDCDTDLCVGGGGALESGCPDGSNPGWQGLLPLTGSLAKHLGFCFSCGEGDLEDMRLRTYCLEEDGDTFAQIEWFPNLEKSICDPLFVVFDTNSGEGAFCDACGVLREIIVAE
jgi:hypothetical protein